MLFAAGRGERMRPLTDHTPKPLIPFNGQPLIDRHLKQLSDAGFRDIIINLSWLADQIRSHVGDGSQYGAKVVYSEEGPVPLESGGGIAHARALLGDEPFLAVNSDIVHDFPLACLRQPIHAAAHLVVVPNPPHNESGDFSLRGNVLLNEGKERYTFSGIAVYHCGLVADPGQYSIIPKIRELADANKVSGELHKGRWADIGTPQRLETTQALYSS